MLFRKLSSFDVENETLRFTLKINIKIKLKDKRLCIKKKDDEAFGSGRVEEEEGMKVEGNRSAMYK